MSSFDKNNVTVTLNLHPVQLWVAFMPVELIGGVYHNNKCVVCGWSNKTYDEDRDVLIKNPVPHYCPIGNMFKDIFKEVGDFLGVGTIEELGI